MISNDIKNLILEANKFGKYLQKKGREGDIKAINNAAHRLYVSSSLKKGDSNAYSIHPNPAIANMSNTLRRSDLTPSQKAENVEMSARYMRTDNPDLLISKYRYKGSNETEAAVLKHNHFLKSGKMLGKPNSESTSLAKHWINDVKNSTLYPTRSQVEGEHSKKFLDKILDRTGKHDNIKFRSIQGEQFLDDFLHKRNKGYPLQNRLNTGIQAANALTPYHSAKFYSAKRLAIPGTHYSSITGDINREDIIKGKNSELGIDHKNIDKIKNINIIRHKFPAFTDISPITRESRKNKISIDDGLINKITKITDRAY